MSASGILDSEGWMIDVDFNETSSETSHNMLLDLISFYYTNRLYLLRSFNIILAHKPSSDEKSDIILNCQAKIRGPKLLDQLELLLKTTPVPARRNRFDKFLKNHQKILDVFNKIQTS